MIEDRDTERAGVIDALAGVVRTIRKRIVLVLIVPLVAGVAAYWITSGQPERYQATSSLLLRDRHLAEMVSGYSPPYRDPTREAETNLSLVSSVAVEDRVAEALPQLSDDVRDGVTVEQRGGSDLVSVTAKSSSSDAAALIANTWGEEYIALRREADRAQIAESIAGIERRLQSLSSEQSAGAEGERLRDQRNRLELIASLQTGNAELFERATPSSTPVEPRPLRTAVLAALVSFAVALAGALLIQRFDRRVNRVEDMEEILRTRVLGDVPASRRLRWRKGSHGGDDPGPRELEAFRVLRANLTYFGLDGGLDSLLVTSASPGEGKSTVAIHLAQAYADGGARTLLLEADLRRPTLAARMKLGGSPGLTGLLRGAASPAEAVIRVPSNGDYGILSADGSGASFRGPVSQLDVLPAGHLPPNPADLLESRAFDDVLERLKRDYDVIVLDGPPVLGISDTTALTRRVSGTLVVARLGTATTATLSAMERQLSLVGARVLGLVVNDVSDSSGDGYYAAASTVGVAD